MHFSTSAVSERTRKYGDLLTMYRESLWNSAAQLNAFTTPTGVVNQQGALWRTTTECTAFFKINHGLWGDIFLKFFFFKCTWKRKRPITFSSQPPTQLQQSSPSVRHMNTVELYCTWHIRGWSHGGLLSLFSFHPTNGKSSGLRLRQPYTIPAIS